MKIIFIVLSFMFCASLLFAQKNEDPQTDTMIYQSRKCRECPIVKRTVIYHRLRCGLYLGSNGDLAFRSSAFFEEAPNFRTVYVSKVFTNDDKDSLTDFRVEMKSIIDTATFEMINFLYWKDKNRVYGFNPMSDGGTVFIATEIDPKTLVVTGESGYAKDKLHVFYRGDKIEGADIKTLRLFTNTKWPQIAVDKFHFYSCGEILTEKEVKEKGSHR